MSTHKPSAMTFIAILVLMSGIRNAVAFELSMEDAKVVGAYPLTMDTVQRKYAAAAEMARLSVSDPTFAGQMQAINQVKTLDAQIKALAGIPKATAILQAHGITARDYSLTTLAVNFAQMPQVPEQYRQANSPLAPMLVAAPPDHIEFVRAHIDEIHKLTAAIMQARKEAQH